VAESVTANVVDADINSSWNDVSGGQALAVSNDDGETFEPAGGQSNTQTLSASFTTVGVNIVGRATMEGYGDAANSPRLNANPQRIESWQLSYSGNDVSVIDQRRFTGDALTVAQQLHKKAGLRFNIGTDGSITTFDPDETTQTPDWTVKNRRPAVDLYGYANRIVVYGGKLDDGTRPKATAVDTAEVDAVGSTETDVILSQNVTTLDGVKSEARAELSKRVDERKTTGTLEVWPTNIEVGRAYDVDWYGDGQPVDASLNTLSIQKGYANDTAELQFERDRGTDPKVVNARFVTKSLADIF
jgi:hypothetical protein